MKFSLSLASSLALAMLALGCSSRSESLGGTGSSIVLGTPATGHPEAVLLDLSQNGTTVAYCSGAVIAPYVVLTAGHCVAGFNGWTARAVFAGGQIASSSTGLLLDYVPQGTSVNFATHDVALVVLSTPIHLDVYPTIAQAPVANGTNVFSIGRVQDGNVSTTTLFQGAPAPVTDGAAWGEPYDYVGVDIIQEGDSGGPAELAGSSPPTIVAVASGAGALMTNNTPNGSYESLARVDLVAGWIGTQIAAFPSGAPLSAQDAGADAGADASLDGAPPGDADETESAAPDAAPPSCTPSCANQACGAADGCGGVCPTGTCGTGLHCENAACVCDATSCSGCCSGNTCVDGNETATCGAGGNACAACASGSACHAGTCDSDYLLMIGLPENGSTGSSQTWTWDGSSWAQTVPATLPSPSSGLVEGTIVTVGSTPTFFGSTGLWTWNGGTWTQVTTPVAPPPRTQHAAAVLGSTMVIFGGVGANSQYLGDTWTWDGTTWTQAQVQTSPPARGGLAMAPSAGGLVMFGGTEGNSFCSNDTWIWNGTSWTQVDVAANPTWMVGGYWEPAADAPPARQGHAMAAWNGQVVLFGGTNGSPSDSTFWTWNGTSWSSARPSPSPMGGVYGDAILVPYHDSLVLFGGLENGTAMWSWNGSWTLIGNGPTMENAAMAWVP